MKNVVRAAVLLILAITPAVCFADRYPPGPTGACHDSVTLYQIQNPSATCHPLNVSGASSDTVYGVGGIVIGFDANASAYAFYIQNNGAASNGTPWEAIDVFTEGTNLAGNLGLQIGDSVVVSGRLDEFGGGGEIRSLNFSQGSPNGPFVRKISSGNHVPNIHVGTVAELQQKISNPNAEQWEGSLVRINGPMRVVRVSGTVLGDNRGLGQFDSWIVVDDVVCPSGTVGECDSVYIDGLTCATPSYAPPPAGTKVDMVQGLYDQRNPNYVPTGGSAYRIQLRNGNDITVATPPSIGDAFAIYDNDASGAARTDSVMVVFDRAVEKTSAETVGNYSLGSFRAITGAARLNAPQDNRVVLRISNSTNGQSDGDNESITVSGVKGLANGLPMSSQTRPFQNGVMTIARIQAPDPGSNGLGASPCADRSAFAGPGSSLGGRLTFRGVATRNYGSVYYLQDGNAPRSGIAMFGPLASLNAGHRYLISCAVQEFFEETEATNNVYLRDEGPAPIPSPVVRPIALLRDTTCDATQTRLTGEDYEGMLVQVQEAEVAAFPTPPRDPAPGGSFLLTTSCPTFADSILVSNDGAYTYDADSMQVVDVTGVLRFPFGSFRVYPRSDADIVFHSTSGHTITATAGSGGVISPSGPVVVRCIDRSRSFAIAPNAGFLIADLTVDGSSVGAQASYTFTDVTANHTIAASFVPVSAPPQPCGDVNVDQTVNTTDLDLMVAYLLFDGAAPSGLSRADVNADLDVGVGDVVHDGDQFFASGPPPICFVDEIQFQGNVLKQMAQALRDTTNPNVAAKFTNAGNILMQMQSHLQTLITQGQPVDPSAPDSVTAMVNDLHSIGSAIGFGSFSTVSAALGHFSIRFADFTENRGLATVNPLLDQPFVETQGAIEQLRVIADAISDPTGMTDHLHDVNDVFRLSSARLDSLAAVLLAISDPTARADLGLDDPDMRLALENIVQFQRDADVMVWFDSVATTPNAVFTTMTSAAFSNATLSLGNSLFSGANAMIATTLLPLLGLCPDDCTPVCTNRNCMLSKLKVIGWRTTCKISDGKDLTLTFLKLIPVGARAPLKGTVIGAVKALQKILIQNDELGTRICVKIKWEHCENHWCFWPFYKANYWIPHESDWDEVPFPQNTVCWYKGADWPAHMAEIIAAVAAKVAAMCAGI
jgi:hypothetical protein